MSAAVVDGSAAAERPLRIILAVNDLSVGGAERNAVDFATALRRHGHTVRVFSGPGPLAAGLEAEGVARIGRGAQIRRPWSVLQAAGELAAMARGRDVDIVHAFMASSSVAATFAGLMQRASGRRRPALVASVPGLAQHPSEPRWLSHLRLRFLSAGPDIVLAPSTSIHDLLITLGVQEARIRDIEFNAVRLDRFGMTGAPSGLPAKLGLAAGDRVVCAVARLHPVKGLDLVLRAAPAVLARVPNARFLFVGDGPQRAALEALAARLGVADAALFAGERIDVPEILSLATVVVQTTFGLGGPGLSSLEAFASGRPVVGFETAERRAALRDVDAAILVPDGDVAALGSALADLLADPGRAARMGESARELVRNRYDIDVVATRLEAIYREAVTSRDPR